MSAVSPVLLVTGGSRAIGAAVAVNYASNRDAILSLLSPKASYVTGAILSVSGGR